VPLCPPGPIAALALLPVQLRNLHRLYCCFQQQRWAGTVHSNQVDQNEALIHLGSCWCVEHNLSRKPVLLPFAAQPPSCLQGC